MEDNMTENSLVHELEEIGIPPALTLRVIGTHRVVNARDDEIVVDFDFSISHTPFLKKKRMQVLGVGDEEWSTAQGDAGRQLVGLKVSEWQEWINYRHNDAHNVPILSILKEIHGLDKESVGDYVRSLCRSLRYVGSVQIHYAISGSVIPILMTEDRSTPFLQPSPQHVVKVTWSVESPFLIETSAVASEEPERQRRWRERLGQAIIYRDTGEITLETLRPRAGRSMLRRAMAELELRHPISEERDDDGVTRRMVSMGTWGHDTLPDVAG